MSGTRLRIGTVHYYLESMPRGNATEWRPASFPFYEVSEHGDLRLLVDRSNRLAGTILKGSVKKHGYREYKIWIDGKGIHIRAHREVLLAFIGLPPTPDHQCAHWDGNPLNNHYSNLRWATPAENDTKVLRFPSQLGRSFWCWRRATNALPPSRLLFWLKWRRMRPQTLNFASLMAKVYAHDREYGRVLPRTNGQS
jgi:hypothetical protein